MLENRNLHHDLAALALTALTVFLALSLATYHRSDPIEPPLGSVADWHSHDQLAFPQNAAPRNVCGHWGALAADAMLSYLGLAAYCLVLSMSVTAVILLRRQSIDAPPKRLAGWLASLAAAAALADLAAPDLPVCPVVGAGGKLGALIRFLSISHLGLGGALIALGSLLLAGLLLTTDYVLIQFVAKACGRLADGTRKTAKLTGGRKRAPARKTDLDTTARATAPSPAVDGDDPQEAEETFEIDAPSEAEVEKPAQASPPVRQSNNEKKSKTWFGKKRQKKSGKTDLDAKAPTAKPDPAALVERWTQAAPAPDEDGVYEAIAPPDDVAPWDETDGVDKKSAALPEEDAGHEEAAPEEITRVDPPIKMSRPHRGDELRAVREQLNALSEGDDSGDYELPTLELLTEGEEVCFDSKEQEVRRKARILEKTFDSFGYQVKVVEVETGPVIAQYEIELEAGLRLSKITALADDLAIALRAPSVRIVAPIPGKNTVGIEVPNEERQVVRLREVMEESHSAALKMNVPLFLGKDVAGRPMCVDLSKLPHLLIAGRTGTGKSVCLNAIISSILMTKRPDEVRMLMIDPKMVELSGYGRLPHLMHPVVTDMRKAEAILAWAVEKMEERYALLAKAGVRHICSYNELTEEEIANRLGVEDEEQMETVPTHLPFIVIVADEIADMMMTAGKEVEQHIIRLAQKSRAVGIHLILATQKPTVDVITGLIKSNLPARIAFQVASRTDSRVVLDEMGADKLLGNGDMLFLSPGTSMLLRGQGTYLSDNEINSVVDCVSTDEQQFVKELVNMKVDSEESAAPGALPNRDDLYESAVDIVVREGRGSVSMLQRTLGIGYGRAARLIDYMAEDRIVGPYIGSKARDVLVSIAEWERMQGIEPEPEDESWPADATTSS